MSRGSVCTNSSENIDNRKPITSLINLDIGGTPSEFKFGCTYYDSMQQMKMNQQAAEEYCDGPLPHWEQDSEGISRRLSGPLYPRNGEFKLTYTNTRCSRCFNIGNSNQISNGGNNPRGFIDTQGLCLPNDTSADAVCKKYYKNNSKANWYHAVSLSSKEKDNCKNGRKVHTCAIPYNGCK